MLADTHFGGLALEFMQVLFKESCTLVQENNHIYTKKRSRESYNTSYYIAREKKTLLCWWKRWSISSRREGIKSETDKPSRWSVWGWSDLMEVSNGMIQSGEENNTVKENSESGNTEGKWHTFAKSRSNTGSETNHFPHSKLLLFCLRN